MVSSSANLSEIVDGVHRSSRTGIKVVVVGGGVGGLLAALECWRKGHEVEVIERNSSLSTLGDFFTIGPSGLATLHYYPKMLAEYKQDVWDSPLQYYSHSGNKLFSQIPEWNRADVSAHAAEGLPIVSFMKTRPQIVEMLLNQMARLGIPIFWGRKVESFDEDNLSGEARVTTDTNEVFIGDVVVAADGVGTKSHAAVTGHPIPMVSSGYAIARSAWSPSKFVPGSKATELLQSPGETPEVQVYLADDMHLLLFLTPNKVGLAYTHKDNGSATESWHHSKIDPEKIIDMLMVKEGWNEAVIDFVRQAPKDTVDWKLTWRDPQPVWTSKGGRIVQLGDSAHSFLPTSANGATQALEDGISLAECLRQGGRAHVPWSTKVHQKLRYERVSVIQKIGIVNRTALHHVDVDLIEQGKKTFEATFHLGRWIWAHNAEKYAREQYSSALSHLREGSEFENTNLPPGHVYEDWTVASEMKKQAAGLPSQLRQNGDWSI